MKSRIIFWISNEQFQFANFTIEKKNNLENVLTVLVSQLLTALTVEKSLWHYLI
jgi:hypothetical protein